MLKSLHSTLRGRLSSAAGGVQESDRERGREMENETEPKTANE